jgi:hypothetical protein
LQAFVEDSQALEDGKQAMKDPPNHHQGYLSPSNTMIEQGPRTINHDCLIFTTLKPTIRPWPIND